MVPAQLLSARIAADFAAVIALHASHVRDPIQSGVLLDSFALISGTWSQQLGEPMPYIAAAAGAAVFAVPVPILSASSVVSVAALVYQATGAAATFELIDIGDTAAAVAGTTFSPTLVGQWQVRSVTIAALALAAGRALAFRGTSGAAEDRFAGAVVTLSRP